MQHFITKYGAYVSTKWSTSLDTVCASAVNPANVTHWFNMVKCIYDTYNFHPSNIYNFDESGFPRGKGKKEHVITCPGTKIQHANQDGNRENITVMCTVCADSTVLTPVILFKGERYRAKSIHSRLRMQYTHIISSDTNRIS